MLLHGDALEAFAGDGHHTKVAEEGASVAEL